MGKKDTSIVSDSYEDVVSKIGEEKLYQRLNELIDTAKSFIIEANLEDVMECSERIMLQVVLDYFSDIIRLKDFHGIEYVRQEKILAYEIAWILKRKPLQYVKQTDNQTDVFINEKFAAFLYINELLKAGDFFVEEKNIGKYKYFLDLLYYYFQYRECNPQAIELSIEAFKAGTIVI